MRLEELEAAYLKAQGEVSTEFMRFSLSRSTTYGPDRMTQLSIAAKKARIGLMEFKFGKRDRSKD